MEIEPRDFLEIFLRLLTFEPHFPIKFFLVPCISIFYDENRAQGSELLLVECLCLPFVLDSSVREWASPLVKKSIGISVSLYMRKWASLVGVISLKH